MSALGSLSATVPIAQPHQAWLSFAFPAAQYTLPAPDPSRWQYWRDYGSNFQDVSTETEVAFEILSQDRQLRTQNRGLHGKATPSSGSRTSTSPGSRIAFVSIKVRIAHVQGQRPVRRVASVPAWA
eukprot:242673-Rhodomonas_salina.3